MCRPTVAEIELSALRHNLKTVKELAGSPSKILAIVKANAYGHGAVGISRELAESGVDFLGVATGEEAIELRSAGIQTPLMIMGGIYIDQVEDVIRYNLIPVIFDLDTALNLNTIASQHGLNIKTHVKIDTGMGRIGILPTEVEDLFNRLRTCNNLIIDGLLTHLAVADACDEHLDTFTRGQIDTFLKVNIKVRDMGFTPSYLHLANSAAIIRKLEPCFNLIRPGIMLYGISPSQKLKSDIKPVLSLKTKIIALKKVPKGSSISYKRTFIANRESLIATLPIGYADGYSRQFSNRAHVIVHGIRVPVVGLVCMDMIMVDVTDVSDVKLYDEVTLIGSQGGECISAEELAEISKSIPYEVLCAIGSRVPRVYVNGG